MKICTILNDDEYLFQHISNNNNKLLIYIKSAPDPDFIEDENGKLKTQRHEYDADKIDIYSKTILKCGYDIVYIRSKNIDNMYDSDCAEAFTNVQNISRLYNIVDGMFVCGGSVLGLYFSKLIQYRNIFCISSRFIERMTLDNARNFTYKNYKVTPVHLNQDAKYYVIYNKYQINSYDANTAKWLFMNTDNRLIYSYDNKLSKNHDNHLLEQQMYLKTYLKDFVPNILNENILDINGMHNENFN